MSRRNKKEIEITNILLAKATYDYIIDVLRPKLTRPEFALLLVIARQTVGWKDPDCPDIPKERDWLSMVQLKKRTGYGRTSISTAQEGLFMKGYILITLPDEHYEFDKPITLSTPKQRQIYGYKYKDKAKFLYSLSSEFMRDIKRQVEEYLSNK